MSPVDRVRKRYRKKDILIMIGYALGIIVCCAIVIGFIWFEIWIWKTYGNMPYNEVPAWVNWFMGRK